MIRKASPCGKWNSHYISDTPSPDQETSHACQLSLSEYCSDPYLLCLVESSKLRIGMSENFDHRWKGTHLPKVYKLPSYKSGELPPSGDVEMEIVVRAMMHGESHVTIKDYFDHFRDEKLVRKRIHAWVEGFPPIFYAVKTNDEEMIRMMAEYGGDVDVCHNQSKIPLLAFAVMCGKEEDTTQTVITLLALGASAQVFPKALYSPFSVDMSSSGPPYPIQRLANKIGASQTLCGRKWQLP